MEREAGPGRQRPSRQLPDLENRRSDAMWDLRIQLLQTAPNHLFDVDFAAEKVGVGRFIYVRMRMDRSTVPAGILRSYVQIEEQAALEAVGRSYLTKEERRQARDAANQRADKEARSGAFRRIAAHQLLIDPASDLVYFGNRGKPANERLASHLFKYHESIFNYLRHPGMDATNWRGEQAIRFGVVNRKVWGGNRTWPGAAVQSTLMSVIQTCIMRTLSPVRFLINSLTATKPILVPAWGR